MRENWSKSKYQVQTTNSTASVTGNSIKIDIPLEWGQRGGQGRGTTQMKKRQNCGNAQVSVLLPFSLSSTKAWPTPQPVGGMSPW